nr:hypothetical protein [Tanacetum cinerariifolium]
MFEAITIKTTLHEKLSINQECQDLRSNPSKDGDLNIEGDQRFKTSTLGEIVSLEKSNKNVNGLRILTSYQSMMHTSKDDYLINALRFILAKELTQIYGAILLECLTSPTMKESKAYKTYLGYAIGTVPHKIARRFKKASSSKKDNDLVPVNEEPVTKGKRVKRSVKKSSTKPVTSIVIKEPLLETMSKGKEELDVTRGKGIDLLSETHPSGSGMVAKKPPRVDKITPTITNEGTGDKPGVPDVTNDDSTKSESESWGNDEDNSNTQQDSSNESSEQENEKSDDVIKSDEEKGMDDTTYQFDDDVDAKLKEPTQTDKEFIQGEALEKEVAELKKDPLHTHVTSLVDSHLDTMLGETREEFMIFLSESFTERINEQVKDQLPQILSKEVSNFALPMIEKLIKESCDEVTLAKVRKDKDKDEDPSVGSDRGLKKRKLSKDAEPTTGPKKKDSTSGSSKGTIGLQSRGDVYSTKRILDVTHFKVMRKHGYGYLEEIKNRCINLLGDDVADFAIALRMFTRSLVIQKRVEDLQLGVESYQKLINVTKPDTTRPDFKKGTFTLHTKTLKDSFIHYQEYLHDVLAKEKMEQIGKENSSFHDQGHQQAAKGKEDDKEFKEICWW